MRLLAAFLVLLLAPALAGCSAFQESAGAHAGSAVGRAVGKAVADEAGALVGEVAGYTVGTIFTVWLGKKVAAFSGTRLRDVLRKEAKEAVGS